MKLFLTSSVLLLTAFLPASWSSPIDSPLEPRNSPKTCTASYIQSAESHAKKSEGQTISALCSSVLSRYKTVTHSVYTKIVKPTITVDTITTAPRPEKTETITAKDTQSNSHTVAVEPRGQSPCQEVESLLSLSAHSATPFCSCYLTATTTSTKTVTYEGVTTETPAHVTHYTKTVTPTPSTDFVTVHKKTTVVTTGKHGTSSSVTNTGTSTHTAASSPTESTQYWHIKIKGGQFDGYYLQEDRSEEDFFNAAIFTANVNDSFYFNFDSQGRLADGTLFQYVFTIVDDPLENVMLFRGRSQQTTSITFPKCYKEAATEQFFCDETDIAEDLRHTMLVCDLNREPDNPPAPVFVLDDGPDSYSPYKCAPVSLYAVKTKIVYRKRKD